MFPLHPHPMALMLVFYCRVSVRHSCSLSFPAGKHRWAIPLCWSMRCLLVIGSHRHRGQGATYRTQLGAWVLCGKVGQLKGPGLSDTETRALSPWGSCLRPGGGNKPGAWWDALERGPFLTTLGFLIYPSTESSRLVVQSLVKLTTYHFKCLFYVQLILTFLFILMRSNWAS